MITRREALITTVTAAAAVAATPTLLTAAPQAAATAATGPHKLPDLPYPTDALEPHIDARTMEIHHGKHHAAYVTNLNAAVAGKPEENLSIEEICATISKYPVA